MTTWYSSYESSVCPFTDATQIDNLGFGKQERLKLNEKILDETLSFRLVSQATFRSEFILIGPFTLQRSLPQDAVLYQDPVRRVHPNTVEEHEIGPVF